MGSGGSFIVLVLILFNPVVPLPSFLVELAAQVLGPPTSLQFQMLVARHGRHVVAGRTTEDSEVLASVFSLVGERLPFHSVIRLRLLAVGSMEVVVVSAMLAGRARPFNRSRLAATLSDISRLVATMPSSTTAQSSC